MFVTESKCLQFSGEIFSVKTCLQRKFTVEKGKREDLLVTSTQRRIILQPKLFQFKKNPPRTSTSGDAEGVKFENFKSLPASQRKMETQADDSADEISESEGENLQGFRLIC